MRNVLGSTQTDRQRQQDTNDRCGERHGQALYQPLSDVKPLGHKIRVHKREDKCGPASEALRDPVKATALVA